MATADRSAIADLSAAITAALDADQITIDTDPDNELIESLQCQDQIEAKHYGLQSMLHLPHRRWP